MTERRRYRVHGRVQGVGFRAFVWRQVQRLELEGWVRNRFDGTVEVLTACRDWPVHKVKVAGITYRVPGLLVRH